MPVEGIITMEQKKTLWIALSSGIFLLVVLGAALIIYAPGSKLNSNAVALRESGQVWTAGLPPSQTSSQGALIASVPEPGSVSGTFVPSSASKTEGSGSSQNGVMKTDSMTVYSEKTTLFTGDIQTNASSQTASVSSNVTATNSKGEQVMQETGNRKKVEEPKQTKVSQAVASSASATAGPAKTSSSAAAQTPAASQTAAAPAHTQLAAAKTSGTASGSAKTGTSSKSGTGSSSAQAKSAASGSSAAKTAILPAAHYWVQVASYSTKDNADEARNILDAKDLPCEVFTFTKDSKLYYRVRVGPYKTESEAERWKKSIDAIDLFKTAQSYVVDSSARASR